MLSTLDVHLEQTVSELELKSEKLNIVIFSSEFNGQVLVRQGYLYSLQSILNLTSFLSTVVVYRSNRGMRVWVKTEDAPRVVPVQNFLLYIFLNFATILTDGKMNNIIILQHQGIGAWCLLKQEGAIKKRKRFFSTSRNLLVKKTIFRDDPVPIKKEDFANISVKKMEKAKNTRQANACKFV